MPKLIYHILIIGLICASCAVTAPTIQPQVNSFILAGREDQALKIMESGQQAYGPNNELLYLLDRGLVLHYARRYRESIKAFEQAKEKFDLLYTRSVSNVASTWLVNDYRAPYRGEDFERVMINVFQGMNFLALQEWDEALVEARNVDAQLNLINSQYDEKQKNVYREDGFARLLSGILYETAGSYSGYGQDLNDAFIAYKKAVAVYESDYAQNYGVVVPQILKENILTMADWMGGEEKAFYRQKFQGIDYLTVAQKRQKAEIYVIQYNGFSPIKYQDTFPIPTGDGIIKLAFPRYHQRVYPISFSQLEAEELTSNIVRKTESQLGEPIGKIALKSLENRKGRIIAKTTMRSVAKYAAVRTAQEGVKHYHGETAGHVVNIAGQIYNYASEMADLRSWQTLPDQIQISRLFLDPGEYNLKLRNLDEQGHEVSAKNLATVKVFKGEKKFFIIRTAY